MKNWTVAVASAAIFAGAAASSAAQEAEGTFVLPDRGPGFDETVVAIVDLSDQTMHLYVDGALSHIWYVSTGLGGHRTPTGSWNAYWLSPNHRSSLYNNAPMPWSVFFNGNYAVHGTTAIDNLGNPASHGCVRLHPDNAEIFFKLVESHGIENARVAIVD